MSETEMNPSPAQVALREPSRRRATIIQVIGNQTTMLIAIAQNIVLIPIFISFLGAKTYGTWITVASAAALLGVLDLGITSLASQATASAFAKRDSANLEQLLATLAFLSTLVAGIIGCATYGATTFFLRWLMPPPDIARQFSNTIIALVGFDVAFVFLMCIAGSMLFGLQSPTTHLVAYSIGCVAGTSVSIIGMRAGMGLMSVPLGSIIRSVVTIGADTAELYALTQRLKVRLLSWPSATIAKRLFRESIWLGSGKIAEALLAQADYIIAGRLLGPTAVTILDVSRRAPQAAAMAVGRLPASFLSGLAHLHGGGETLKANRVRRSLFKLTLIIGIISTVAVAALNSDFVNLWTPGLFIGPAISALLCCYFLVKMAKVTMYNVVFATGNVRSPAAGSLVEVAVHLTLGSLLCRSFGLLGLVLGGITAVSTGTIVQSRPLWATASVRHLVSGIRPILPHFLVPIMIIAVARILWIPRNPLEFCCLGALFVLSSVPPVLLALSRAKEECSTSNANG